MHTLLIKQKNNCGKHKDVFIKKLTVRKWLYFTVLVQWLSRVVRPEASSREDVRF